MDGIVAAKGFIKGFTKWKEENDNNQISGKIFEKKDYGILLSVMQI